MDLVFWLYVMVVLLFPKGSLQGQNEKRLLYDLFTKNYYNPLERPVENESLPIVVTFKIILQQIIDVDEKNQIIHTNLWFQMKWKAVNLVWDPYEYGGVEYINVAASDVWKPDILMYNSADEKFDGTFHTKIIIKHDGSCLWIPPGMFKSTCAIEVRHLCSARFNKPYNRLRRKSAKKDSVSDVITPFIQIQNTRIGLPNADVNNFILSGGKKNITWFPFDDQKCDLKFGSWTYDGRWLDLRLEDDKGGDISTFIRNGEWELIEVPGIRNVQKYDCCDEFFLDLVYTIHIRRRTLYYGFNIIIPCLLISSMSLLLFLLPPDAGEKISLGVTILLSLMVFLLLVAETMPPTSDAVPLIGIYFCCIMVMTTLSVLFTVVVLNFHYRGPETHDMPNWVKIGINCLLARMLCMSRASKVEKRRQSVIQRQRLGDIQMQDRAGHGAGHALLPNLLESEEEFRACVENGRCTVRGEEWARVQASHGNSANMTDEHERMRTVENSCSLIKSDLVSLLREVRKITHKIRQEEEETEIKNEWKFAALVIDRMCLWICVAATTISTAAILGSAPHLVA